MPPGLLVGSVYIGESFAYICFFFVANGRSRRNVRGLCFNHDLCMMDNGKKVSFLYAYMRFLPGLPGGPLLEP